MKKLLVTGSSGLVGTSIRSIISEQKSFEPWYTHKVVYVTSKDADLCNFKQTAAMLKHYKPDYVIHLAAEVGGLYKNMNSKVEMLEKNLRMNDNIVTACFQSGVKNFMGALSTCIFPDKTTYPIDETMLHNGPPHTSNDAYAYAKRMMEVQCRAYNEQHDMNYNCVIPTNIYGENDNYNLEDSHVIPGLIHRCYLAKESGDKFIVRGTGKPLRQFIYSKDLARAMLQLTSTLQQDNVIVVGNDLEHSIRSIATMIANEFNYVENMSFDDTYSDGQYKKTADNRKFLSMIPEFKATDIQVGIKNTVQYFKDTYPNCRI